MPDLVSFLSGYAACFVTLLAIGRWRRRHLVRVITSKPGEVHVVQGAASNGGPNSRQAVGETVVAVLRKGG